jgi:predicted nucleic acid-binding protein
MIVVSDSSPLHYLILIGQVDLLRVLFQEVLVPSVVVEELTHPRAPETVRTWMSAPKEWLKVQTPASVDPSLSALDLGEAHAISLAREVSADALLIDDRKGLLAARRLGLVTVGTLAILERAARDGRIDLSSCLDLLLATNFRAPPAEIARLRGQ